MKLTREGDWTLAQALFATPKEHQWLPYAVFNMFGVIGTNAFMETLRHVHEDAGRETKLDIDQNNWEKK